MLKSRLITLIETMNTEEQALFANLSEAERSVPGKPNQWSPKDIIAHLAAWKEREVENLVAAARKESPVNHDDFEEINAREFEIYRAKSWAEILEKAAEANRRLVEQIAGRTETELEQIWQENRKTWQSIIGTGYIHPIMHLGQIYAERGDKEYGTQLQEKAAAELLELDEAPSWQGTVRYNLACHYALIGETEQAIKGLGKALEQNPRLKDWSREDPDFVSIREEPAYIALYED
jgi:tetratricopeptide (TPR) repeat protein